MKINSELEFTGERLTTVKRSEIMIHHLHRYGLALKLVEDKSVLDIASGEGYGSYLLSQKARSVIGVDISEASIEFAKTKYKRNNLEFKVGLAERIPVEDNSIDVIVSFETIEHHGKHHEMLLEFKRILKPNGVVIISSPDKYNYSDLTNFQNPYHVKELYKQEFQSIMNKYFSYSKFYNQNIHYGSLIVNDNEIGSGFCEIKGNYDNLNFSTTLSSPMYNICIASNTELDLQFFPENSFFNAEEILNILLNKENEIYNSRTYRLGKIISFPFRLFRK